MKTICITGATAPDIHYIEGILTQAGMGAALSSARDESVTLDFWHTQVAARLKELPAQTETIELGRVWEQIASDIFVANINQPLWGWSDTRALPLLDFWQSFDSQIRFVLVTCSAQRFITQAIATGEPVDSVKKLLGEWAVHHVQLLQFFHRYPQKSVLVDVDQCIENPAGLIKACQQAWQIDLNKVHFPSQPPQQFSTLEQYFARELIQTDDQWQSLQNELWSSATPVGSQSTPIHQTDVFEAVRAYRDEKAHQAASLVPSIELTRVSESLAKKTAEAHSMSVQLRVAEEGASLLQAQLQQVEEVREQLLLDKQSVKEQLAAAKAEGEAQKTKVDGLTTQLTAAKTEVMAQKTRADATAKQLEAAKAETAILKSSVETSAKQLATATAEIATQKSRADGLAKQLEAAKAEASTLKSQSDAAAQKLETQLKETQEEADLLLAQLHQVQEELETIFLSNQDAKKQIADLEPLKGKVQELTKQAQTAEAQAATLKKELDSAKAEATIQKTKVETTAKQLATATTEVTAQKARADATAKQLEAAKTETATLKSSVETTAKQLATATAEASAQKSKADDLSKQLETTRASLANKTTETAQLNEQVQNVQEEADLLLAQLHQVQEELEHYFLKYQDVKNILESADARWQRMLQRTPDYFDLESIEIVSQDDAASPRIEWKLKGLDAGGRVLPELHLTTTVEGGVASLELPRCVGDQETFLRWPSAASDQESLSISVTGDAKTARARVSALLQLGRSDWDLIQVLLSVLSKELETPNRLKLPEDLDATALSQALKNLKTQLTQLPPVLRFDEIKLKREQVDPYYEHLWFAFRHVSIGAKRLLDFDFRLSCANENPKTFGEHPKLEFPETTGRDAIANWYEESRDDFGAKLELRFALPQLVDINVWKKLSELDQIFVASLITQLPALLTELENSGVKLQRGWIEWHKLAIDMRQILASYVGRASVQPPKIDAPAQPNTGIVIEGSAMIEPPQESKTKVQKPKAVKQSVTKPATKQVTKLKAQPTAKLAAKPPAKPAAKFVAKPVAKSAALKPKAPMPKAPPPKAKPANSRTRQATR